MGVRIPGQPVSMNREKSLIGPQMFVWEGGRGREGDSVGGQRKRGRERVCMCTLVGGGDRGRDGKSVCALVCVYTRAPSSGALDIEGYQET